MTNPLLDMATFLAGAGLSLTKGTNLFWGIQRGVGGGVPVNAVFVIGGGGTEPQRVMGRGLEIRRPFVIIRVRWSSNGGGDTKARAIQDALDGASISGYLDVKALNSEPQAIGQGSDGNHLWTMQYELVYNKST